MWGQTPGTPPAPAASGARILLLPRKLVAGERATLAVLDVNGRLTPGVTVSFSNGDTLKTDTTGRALFAAPLKAGTIYGAIEGHGGRVTSTVAGAEGNAGDLQVAAAPRVASLTDRFELMGHGFCGEADANHVTVGGYPGLVLASSPEYLAVLPAPEMDPGPAQVTVSCGKKSGVPFTVVFVALELEASSAALAPGEPRDLIVHVRGSTAKVTLEARNLSPEIVELQGGATAREQSSGGTTNEAKFHLTGKARGNMLVSIRLAAPLGPPRE